MSEKNEKMIEAINQFREADAADPDVPDPKPIEVITVPMSVFWQVLEATEKGDRPMVTKLMRPYLP